MIRPNFFALSTLAPAVLAVCLVSGTMLAPAQAVELTQATSDSAPPAAAAKLREGRDALAGQRLDAAQAAFTEAARLAPKDPRPWVGRSAVAQLRGRSAEARDHMARAVTLAPDHPRVLHIQSQLLLDQLDFPAAEAGFRKVLTLAPAQVESQIGLANALAGLGQVGPAREKLAEAAKTAASPADLLQLGSAYLQTGDGEPALAAFNKVLAAQETSAAAHMGRADALERLGRVDQAVLAMNRALELSPANSDLYVKKGLLHEAQKKPDLAETAYREAAKLDDKNAAARNNLAYLLATRGQKLDEALTLAKRAVQLEPVAAMYDTLGTVHLARKEYEPARLALEFAVSKAPDREAYRQRLAMAKAQGKGGDAAMALAAPAPTVAPSPATNMAQAGIKPAAPAAALTTVAATAAAAAPTTTPTTAPAAAAAAAAVAPAVAAAKPAAAPAPAATPTESDPRAAVTARLQAWEAAWESKDSQRYLAAYASSFKSDKHRSRDAWAADRRKKLDKPGEITVELGEPAYEVKGEVVTVTFTQRYSSSNFSDSTKKQMEWIKEGGEWRIRRESTL
jgi:Tfp pilus assembly protein PilF